MPAREYCTGAVYLFVEPMFGQEALSGINLLGTTENFPERSTERSYKQLRNDLSSERAFDYVYTGGAEAVVSLTLTWWDEAIAQALEASPWSNLFGAESLNDIGSLMFQEGLGWRLHIVNHFGGVGDARPTMLNQESGRIYVASLFYGPDRLESGTKESKKHVVFRCGRIFDPAQQRFTLWQPVTNKYEIT